MSTRGSQRFGDFRRPGIAAKVQNRQFFAMTLHKRLYHSAFPAGGKAPRPVHNKCG